MRRAKRAHVSVTVQQQATSLVQDLLRTDRDCRQCTPVQVQPSGRTGAVLSASRKWNFHEPAHGTGRDVIHCRSPRMRRGAACTRLRACIVANATHRGSLHTWAHHRSGGLIAPKEGCIRWSLSEALCAPQPSGRYPHLTTGRLCLHRST